MSVDVATHRSQRASVKAAALAVAATAAVAGAQAPREVPVFDLETPGHRLQATVWETRHEPSAVYELATLPAQLAALPSGAPETLALRYLSEVFRGRLQALPSLYGAGADNRRVSEAAQLYRAMVGRGVERLRLERTWHFGEHRAILVVAEGRGPTRRFTVSVTGTADGVVRSDDWGAWQPIQGLFWYMARNAQLGWDRGREPRDMAFSVTFRPEAGPPLELAFDGRRYELADEWSEPDPEASPEDAAGLMRYATAVAALDDAAFAGLWHGEERAETARLLEEGKARGEKSYWADLEAFKDVFTLDLGDWAVHYFLDGRRPSAPEARPFKRADGGYWLTADLYGNIDQLLRSPLMKTKILELAAGGGP